MPGRRGSGPETLGLASGPHPQTLIYGLYLLTVFLSLHYNVSSMRAGVFTFTKIAMGSSASRLIGARCLDKPLQPKRCGQDEFTGSNSFLTSPLSASSADVPSVQSVFLSPQTSWLFPLYILLSFY